MQATKSRQVLKTRQGESLPVPSAKKRRFNSVLYLESELKKLDVVLDENDVDLEG